MDCPGPGGIAHAARSETHWPLSVGAKATYTCNPCYTGGGTITCQRNGQWTQKPTCTGKILHINAHTQCGRTCLAKKGLGCQKKRRKNKDCSIKLLRNSHVVVSFRKMFKLLRFSYKINDKNDVTFSTCFQRLLAVILVMWRMQQRFLQWVPTPAGNTPPTCVTTATTCRDTPHFSVSQTERLMEVCQHASSAVITP